MGSGRELTLHTAAQISSLITKGWGVAEEQIIIRQPADQRDAK